jgi:hypothetical protein
MRAHPPPPPPPPLPPPPPPPPPRPSYGSTSVSNASARPQTYAEPYGKIQIPSSSYSSAGMSHRNTSSEQHYQQQSTSSYVLPQTPRTDVIERRRSSSSMNVQSASHYDHNAASLSFLLPALASVLWWHDSIIIVQIFLFVVLVLYSFDLINSRDGVAMGVWIGALGMTIGSGYGTLLQVDDNDVSGSTMILFLLQLAVEGMMFCSWVSLDFSFIPLIFVYRFRWQFLC